MRIEHVKTIILKVKLRTTTIFNERGQKIFNDLLKDIVFYNIIPHVML